MSYVPIECNCDCDAKLLATRKSSCVNTRGIPPATQQVLALLFCPRQEGLPQSWLQGVPHPNLAREYPSPVLAVDTQSWLGGGGAVLRPGLARGHPIPGWEYPSPILTLGGNPVRSLLGVPHVVVPPTRTGVPPRKDLRPVTWKIAWDWGTPPPGVH